MEFKLKESNGKIKNQERYAEWEWRLPSIRYPGVTKAEALLADLRGKGHVIHILLSKASR